MVDFGLDNRIVIAGERDLGTIRLEQVLVNMESGPERLERSFKTPHRIFLRSLVQALVIDSADPKHHSHIAALGQKRCLAPLTVEIDVIVQCRGLFPRLDDFRDAQHQRTSTRGSDCFAASYRVLNRSDLARMRRSAGSLPVTQQPKANPPPKSNNPATRLLNRLKAPTAATQTKKNNVRSTPRYVRGLCKLL